MTGAMHYGGAAGACARLPRADARPPVPHAGKP